MTRRDLIPVTLAAVLVPATIAGVLWLMIPKAPAAIPFSKPTHRVAIATEALLKAELASCRRGGFESTRMPTFAAAATLPGVPAAGLPSIDVDDQFFLIQPSGPSKTPQLMQLTLATFTGRTREGREVSVTITPDPFAEGCVIDFQGDARLAEALRPKIAEALAHPAHPPGSDEDEADLLALVGPNAKSTTMKTIVIPAPAAIGPPPPVVVQPPPAPGPVPGSPGGPR